MKKIMSLKVLVSFLTLAINSTGCYGKIDETSNSAKHSEVVESDQSNDIIFKPYNGVTLFTGPQLMTSGIVFEKHQYNPEDIFTYCFDSTNVFKGSEKRAAEILEAGKDPGLGIRSLHKQGITGKDVNVAIFVFSSYYDLKDRDNVTKCKPGYPANDTRVYTEKMWKGMLFAPASYRTVAREYVKGECGYRYHGLGGRSWAVPYVAGVLALGYQVNPKLDQQTMKALLFKSSWVNDMGNHLINPAAFIEAVRAY